MKKAVSIFLVIVTVFSLSFSAVAASEKCNCGMTPVVYVVGFGDPIYENPETEEAVSLFPPSDDAITASVPALVKAVILGIFAGNFDAFGENAVEAVDKMLGPAACDKNGNPAENTGVDFDEVPTADTHKKAAFVELDSVDNGYFRFAYDWRVDPIENAKKLKEYIKEVKKLTGHNEVVIACHSQGNTVVTSYLHLFGNKGIEKILFLSPAYKGLSLMGSLFSQQVDVVGKGDALIEYIKGLMGYDDITGQLVGAILTEINEYGTLDAILYYLQQILDSQLDRIINESLKDILGTLPGVWSFVPDEYYDDAKKSVFKDSDEYDGLIERIDYYHYNVQNKAESIIRKAKANGTAIVIAAGYNISSIPVTVMDGQHSDMLIDTEYMSLGATCAPIGETLGENYKQKNTACGHNHVSADNMIDASTCEFPEYTWFVNGNGHNDFGTAYCEFIEWAIRYDGQPTVHSNEKYPQFTDIVDGKVVPVTAPMATETRSNNEIIITSIIALIKESFAK